MGKKVVLDTNILISALGWNGKPRIIFEKCVDRAIELFICKEQIDELRRVMDYPKFSFTEEQKRTFVSIILEIATLVEITCTLKIIEEDPDDNMILETAIIGGVNIIVTGDPHLLKLKKFGKIKIITAAEYLKKNR